MRLDQIIAEETAAVRRRIRRRKGKLRAGPGRPDLFASPEKEPVAASSPEQWTLAERTKIAERRRQVEAHRKFQAEQRALVEGARDGNVSGGSKELGMLRELRSKYNQLKSLHDSKDARLRELHDTYSMLQREDDVLDMQSAGEQMIEEELEAQRDAESKMREETSYTLTLEHMLERLKSERVNFDTTLHAYEDALQVRRVEAKQVEVVSREVMQARAEEQRALERMKEQAATERVYWAKNLKERREIARKREDMRKWFEARKQKDADIAADAAGDLSARDEAMLRLKATSMHMRGEVMSKGMDELREAITYHEDMKSQLVLASGLNDAKEIVERFKAADAQHRRNKERVAELESFAARLRTERRELLEKLNNIKYSGTGASEFNRAIVEDLTKRREDAVRRTKRLRVDFERNANILLEMRQSVNHLAERLMSLPRGEPFTPGAALERSGASQSKGLSLELLQGVANESLPLSERMEVLQALLVMIRQTVEGTSSGTRAASPGDAALDSADADVGGLGDSAMSAALNSPGGHSVVVGGHHAAGLLADEQHLNEVMEQLVTENLFNVRVAPSAPGEDGLKSTSPFGTVYRPRSGRSGGHKSPRTPTGLDGRRTSSSDIARRREGRDKQDGNGSPALPNISGASRRPGEERATKHFFEEDASGDGSSSVTSLRGSGARSRVGTTRTRADSINGRGRRSSSTGHEVEEEEPTPDRKLVKTASMRLLKTAAKAERRSNSTSSRRKK